MLMQKLVVCMCYKSTYSGNVKSLGYQSLYTPCLYHFTSVPYKWEGLWLKLSGDIRPLWVSQANESFSSKEMNQILANRSAKPLFLFFIFLFYIPANESVSVLMVIEPFSFFYPTFLFYLFLHFIFNYSWQTVLY